MTKDEILAAIGEAIVEATDNKAEFDATTDLIAAGLLDSLDSMVFLLRLQERTGVAFPTDEDLEEGGFFKVATLIDFIQDSAK